MLADRGYDADWYREALEDKGITPCIPSRKNRKVPIPHDEARYRKRHKIENSFARLKDWRRVATRYDRCPKVFLSACALAAVVMFWLCERYWTRRPKLTVSILPPPSRQQRAANVVSPRCGCHLTVADKALLHNAKFVIIRPIPAAFTIGSRQNFDLRAVDKVGHKGGLTIGANTSSDGRPRRLTTEPR